MPAFTILLPHRRNHGNDKALSIALDCLFTNTRSDFHLIIDAATDEPLYPRINRMVEQANTDCVVYWSSDMFAGPDWDHPMLSIFDKDSIVTNVLVEPGVIGVHPANLKENFGTTPETFKRKEFEAWCKNAPLPEQYWYAPWMMSRESFLEHGSFETDLMGDHHGFTSADTVFFDNWKFRGKQIKRARSFVYHLQRYSQVDEQIADKRK